MDDTERLEYPMYQALWRTKHNGEDALAIEWPGAPILLFLYRCTSATDFDEVQELAVTEIPAEHATEVGWFYQIDREKIRETCTTEKPPADAESASDWIRGVTELLLKETVFWKGDSRADLLSFGALEEDSPGPVITELAPSEELDETLQELDAEYVISEPNTDEAAASEHSISEHSIAMSPSGDEAAPAGGNASDKDEITYDSGSDPGASDMEIEWFLPPPPEPHK